MKRDRITPSWGALALRALATAPSLTAHCDDPCLPVTTSMQAVRRIEREARTKLVLE